MKNYKIGKTVTKIVAIGAFAAVGGCASTMSVSGNSKISGAPVEFMISKSLSSQNTTPSYKSAPATAPSYAAPSNRIPFDIDTKLHASQKVGRPYRIMGKIYVPKHEPDYHKSGQASWYGPKFHGRKTANGEIFDRNKVSAAHPTLPLNSMVLVSNLDNGTNIVVRINDRGPFAEGRIIDLSEKTARMIGMHNAGIANVKVRYLGPAATYKGYPQGQAFKGNLPGSSEPVPAPQPKAKPAQKDKSKPIIPRIAQAKPDLTPVPNLKTAPGQKFSQLDAEPQPKQNFEGRAYDPTDSVTITVSGMYQMANFSDSSKLHYLQLASFSDAGRAQAAQNKVSSLGHSQVETAVVNGKTYHRVLMGPFAAQDQADRVKAPLAGLGFADARIVTRKNHTQAQPQATKPKPRSTYVLPQSRPDYRLPEAEDTPLAPLIPEVNAPDTVQQFEGRAYDPADSVTITVSGMYQQANYALENGNEE